jgi:histidyl-tRNA synthetase
MPGEPASFAPSIELFIAAMGPAARIKATALAHQLRTAGVTVEIEHREVGFKAQFRRADKLRARLSLALGEAELATGAAKLKDMAARSETAIELAGAVAAVMAALGR